MGISQETKVWRTCLRKKFVWKRFFSISPPPLRWKIMMKRMIYYIFNIFFPTSESESEKNMNILKKNVSVFWVVNCNSCFASPCSEIQRLQADVCLFLSQNSCKLFRLFHIYVRVLRIFPDFFKLFLKIAITNVAVKKSGRSVHDGNSGMYPIGVNLRVSSLIA